MSTRVRIQPNIPILINVQQKRKNKRDWSEICPKDGFRIFFRYFPPGISRDVVVWWGDLHGREALGSKPLLLWRRAHHVIPSQSELRSAGLNTSYVAYLVNTNAKYSRLRIDYYLIKTDHMPISYICVTYTLYHICIINIYIYTNTYM